MSKIETVSFVQRESDTQVVQVIENYTQVSGIYGSQIVPQFLNSTDNVQRFPGELFSIEQAYAQQQNLRFFRMT